MRRGVVLVGFNGGNPVKEIVKLIGIVKVVGGLFSNGFLDSFHIGLGSCGFGHGQHSQ